MSDKAAMKYRVWWIPQIPMTPFEVDVNRLAEAKLLLETLAKYDLFQLKHKIKPDFSNAGGVIVFDDQLEPPGWTDWTDGDGRDIDDLTIKECRKLDERREAAV